MKKYLLSCVPDGMYDRDDFVELGYTFLINAADEQELEKKCKQVMSKDEFIGTDDIDKPIVDAIYNSLHENGIWDEELDFGTWRLLEIDEEI